MSKNNSAWSSLLKNYYSNKVANKHKSETNTNYSEVLDVMYGNLGNKKIEELVEEVPSHIVVDEQAEKYVEKHIVDESEQLTYANLSPRNVSISGSIKSNPASL